MSELESPPVRVKSTRGAYRYENSCKPLQDIVHPAIIRQLCKNLCAGSVLPLYSELTNIVVSGCALSGIHRAHGWTPPPSFLRLNAS